MDPRVIGTKICAKLSIIMLSKLKVQRYNVDALDKVLARRDQRLTQSEYVQKVK